MQERIHESKTRLSKIDFKSALKNPRFLLYSSLALTALWLGYRFSQEKKLFEFTNSVNNPTSTDFVPCFDNNDELANNGLPTLVPTVVSPYNANNPPPVISTEKVNNLIATQSSQHDKLATPNSASDYFEGLTTEYVRASVEYTVKDPLDWQRSLISASGLFIASGSKDIQGASVPVEIYLVDNHGLQNVNIINYMRAGKRPIVDVKSLNPDSGYYNDITETYELISCQRVISNGIHTASLMALQRTYYYTDKSGVSHMDTSEFISNNTSTYNLNLGGPCNLDGKLKGISYPFTGGGPINPYILNLTGPFKAQKISINGNVTSAVEGHGTATYGVSGTSLEKENGGVCAVVNATTTDNSPITYFNVLPPVAVFEAQINNFLQESLELAK